MPPFSATPDCASPSRRASVLATSHLPPAAEPLPSRRIAVRGKLLYHGSDVFYVRGTTYGPFAPGPDGCEYHTPEIVRRDFEAMVKAGINSVRTYTPPPLWLLDLASGYGLRLMIGIPWEQHIAFLTRSRGRAIENKVRTVVRTYAEHPAVLCYSIGNEIPASIVRWYGAAKIARF